MRLPRFIRKRRDWRASLPAQAHTRVNHVDQRDLQGNVLCGYGDAFARGLFLFVNLDAERPVEARRWIRELAEHVTDAYPWADGHKPSWTLNVALSYAGLEALGVPEPVLASFPEDFRVGMNGRAPVLGETGELGPHRWDPELRREAHILLTLTARTRPELTRREAKLDEQFENSEGLLTCVHRQRAGLLDHVEDDINYAREHFGFADGFSQPAIAGNAGPWQRDGMGTPWKRGRWRNVAPGEFVLGYRGEDGVPPPAPAQPLGRSASYMVVRKMQQRVQAFREFLKKEAEEEAKKNGSDGDSQLSRAERTLAAQLVGRWQDGRSLVRDQRPKLAAGAHRQTAFRERINRFRYSEDPDGYRCPLGAHVRRANPRDDLNPRPANPSPLDLAKRFKWHGKLAQRHRIIRRGLPYPDLVKEDQRREPDDTEDRGLMFVCYQASIERQFELIQGRWLNGGDPFWLGAERDFLTIPDPPVAKIPRPEDQPYGYDRMTIQHPERPRFLAPHPELVRVRGGGYYLTPGLSALRELGSAYWL